MDSWVWESREVRTGDRNEGLVCTCKMMEEVLPHTTTHLHWLPHPTVVITNSVPWFWPLLPATPPIHPIHPLTPSTPV